MHYYPHHIGDFISDTSRLTDSQCMAYLRLIWLYYDTESPLENDPESLAFRIGAGVSDVNLILKHYFILDGDVWRKTRCDSVIAEYHGKADKARKSAELRWKKAKAKRSESDCNANASKDNANASKINANQEPITNNQKPIDNSKDITPSASQDKPAKKTTPKLDYSCWPSMPSDQVMEDWLSMRKRLKANVSQTVINRFASELRKAATYGYTVDQCLAECVTRNWRGFEVQWILNSKQPTGGQNAGQPKSPIERFMRKHYPNNGTGSANDYRPVGRDDGPIRGAVDPELRGDSGRIGPMDEDLIGDFSRTDS